MIDIYYYKMLCKFYFRPVPFAKLLHRFVNNMAWNHDNQDSWTILPNCQAGGQNQSPINIITKEAINITTPIVFEGNYDSHHGKWTNTGHSLQFTPIFAADIPSIKWKGQYFLKQFHFHWGMKPGEGSEHLVNSVSQDGELHFVHQNSNPTSERDQIAVLAVMLQSTDDSLNDTWKQLQIVPQHGESIQLQNINIKDLLPADKSFWHYEGSLTTPPCSENVQWFVFKEVIPIPKEVLSIWSKTPDASGTPILYNFRKVQPTNGRTLSQFQY